MYCTKAGQGWHHLQALSGHSAADRHGNTMCHAVLQCTARLCECRASRQRPKKTVPGHAATGGMFKQAVNDVKRLHTWHSSNRVDLGRSVPYLLHCQEGTKDMWLRDGVVTRWAGLLSAHATETQASC